MRKGQGSLEYLLILAAILAIAVVVVLVANMMLGSPQEANIVNEDKYRFALNGIEIVGYDKPFDGTGASAPEKIIKDGDDYEYNSSAPPDDAEQIGVITGPDGEEYPVYVDDEDYYIEVICTPTPKDCDDGIDNDCDGDVDCDDDDCDLDPACVGCDDGDSDTYDGYDAVNCPTGTDCDDGDALINPGAAEICDNLDNDCDGVIDDFDEVCGGIGECPDGLRTCTGGIWGVCSTHPGGSEYVAYPEICDGLDNDCDGSYDEDFDLDTDTYTTCGTLTTDGSTVLPDCDDGDPLINPGATENCTDTTDNDCDGDVDCADGDCTSDPACVSCVDGDSDTYDGYDAVNCPTGTDCDDGDSLINPGATEICDDLVDNDCDGLVDCDDTTCVGDPACPVEIHNWEDLHNIWNDLTADYILMNALNSTTAGYNTYASSSANSGAGWLPIGDISHKFTGTFEGNNHIISGLNINRPTTTYVGLFGLSHTNSVIQNIGLVNINVIGGSITGGLIGINDGTITDSYATGTVTGTIRVGGLVGVSNADISHCFATGTVTGTGKGVGGLVGTSNGGFVTNSYATATVNGANYVGGLVGWVVWGDIPITDSYATGAVSGTTDVGGLVGNGVGPITNSYWDKTIEPTDNGLGTGFTTSEMTEPYGAWDPPNNATGPYYTWNFATVWKHGATGEYPELQWQG